MAPPGESPGDDDEADRAHVHGFHSYPARMHPAIAAGLVRTVTASGATVLDPFCGSGTVLVEALLAGRRAIGTDLNPLGVRLAALKTTPLGEPARGELVSSAGDIAAFADERRTRRAGATRSVLPRGRLRLRSACPSRARLASRRRGALRRRPEGAPALWLVLSAILVKISRKAADTSSAVASRRIAAGFTARLFARKADELARRLAQFEAQLPPGGHPARVTLDDATRLRTVGASTVDAVVTSPPYAATYDYVAHHALRMRWLGLDTRGMADELGSRRRYARLDPNDAREAWSRRARRCAESALAGVPERCARGLADGGLRGGRRGPPGRRDRRDPRARRGLRLGRASLPATPPLPRAKRERVRCHAAGGACDRARETLTWRILRSCEKPMPLVIFESPSSPPLEVDCPAGGRLVDLCDERSAPIPFSAAARAAGRVAWTCSRAPPCSKNRRSTSSKSSLSSGTTPRRAVWRARP